jgi:hypothetical protein
MSIRFRRVWIGDNAFSCHVSEDVHYVILPVIGTSPVFEGFRVYDLRSGELLEEDFASLDDAKRAVEAVEAA